MKRGILCVICAFMSFLSLVGCFSSEGAPGGLEIYIEQEPSDTVIFFDSFYTSNGSGDAAGKTISEATEYYGYLNYSMVSELASLNCVPYKIDDFDYYVKILAGDSDVDIYMMPIATAQSLMKQGIYDPIDSEIIERHNESCFDSMSEMCLDDNGQPFCMLVNGSASVIGVPKAAIEETGLTHEDIYYLDDYLAYARNYNGKRKSYSSGYNFFSSMEGQYEKYYCDFKNGIADYNTDLYRHIYEELLSGYQRYGKEIGNIEGFDHLYTAAAKTPATTLFVAGYHYQDFVAQPNDWRLFPYPRISDKVEKLSIGATVAFINPFSKNKENALKALETAAENFDAVTAPTVMTQTFLGYPFIKKDKSEYGARYNTESDLFNDYYNIMANGVISTGGGGPISNRNDVDDYQNGRITLDEAIAARQREVEIWLLE